MTISYYRRRLTTLWNLWHCPCYSPTSMDESGGGSSEVRIVHCNERVRNAFYRYKNNKTSSTKYTWYNFLPKSLFLQYRRAAYWFFTAMVGLSFSPFSPHSSASVLFPILFVLGLALGRELREDIGRSRGDKIVNSRPSHVLLDGKEIDTLQWKDLEVGDLVRVTDGEYFPADLLLLSSSGTNGVCYVETKNLDGETNLKVRQALESTWNLNETSLPDFQADVQCEGPNASLYTFNGEIYVRDGQILHLGPAQLLLRDSSLQNTGHIWGAVVYTGHDTKVMQNSTAPPSKRSRIDRSLDGVIYAMLAILLLMSVVTGLVLGYRTYKTGADLWYLAPYEDNPYYSPHRVVVAGIGSFLNALVLYSYLIPLALYVSLEIVRAIQAKFVMKDLGMYEPSIDAGAKVNSPGLNEELGQVDIILSDKTGTLTCNQMDFCRCSIAGVSYGKGSTEVEIAAQRLGGSIIAGADLDSSLEAENRKDGGGKPSYVKGFNFSDSRLVGGSWAQEPNPDVVQLFFHILALCHTAIPEGNVDEPRLMQYRAESPDEAALLIAAKQFGFSFCKRTPSALFVKETLGKEGGYTEQTYELLNVLEFSSERKRMSVIVRYPDQRIMLLSKGADSVMTKRMHPGNKRFLKSTLHHLNQYAEMGLRTLLVAYRELDEPELKEWQTKYAKARSIIGGEREQRIEEVADEIERNLLIVGGTGVEDKLQTGVPETIAHLAQAGISIWVLTGDKVETAINIGYACSLLRKEMQKIIIGLEGTEARAVEEKAEKENLSREDVNKELKSIVAQQLLDGIVDIGILRGEKGVEESHGKSIAGEREKNYLLGKKSGRLSHGERFQEMQKMTSDHRQENEGTSISREAKEQENLQQDVLGSQNRTGRQHRQAAASDAEASFALVIDGYSLALVLAEQSLQEQFIWICKQCVSVLCCRVSPRQKAQVTHLVRKKMGENKLCLAIGDGANDVGMIQAANVGVGITGVEGAQAAMAADYAIGQFRFLEPLLLVHGHWCYYRVSLMISYFFYKVFLIGWIAFCCNIFAFFSGQPLYNDWYASLYNTFFTGVPIVVVGALEQDVSAVDCMRYPQLYRAGHRKEFFNGKVLTMWLLNSLYSGLLIFFFSCALYWLAAFRAAGDTASLPEFGALLFTCLVVVPNVQLAMAISHFTWIQHFTIWGSIALWYLFLLVYGEIPFQYSKTGHKAFIEAVGPSPSYWLLTLVVVVAAVLPDFLYRCFRLTFFPSDYQILLEITARQSRQETSSQKDAVLV